MKGQPMRVKRINGNDGHGCQCGSWLEHWQRFGGGSLPAFCPEVNCVEVPAAATLVEKEDSEDVNRYIIVLCQAHHDAPETTLEVSNFARLLLADVPGTCGRPLITVSAPGQRER